MKGTFKISAIFKRFVRNIWYSMHCRCGSNILTKHTATHQYTQLLLQHDA